MTRLILDAMGGDYAPRANMEGALKALPELSQTPGELVLVGDETVLRPMLAQRKYRKLAEAMDGGQNNGIGNGFRVSLLHASQNIDMEDSIRAIRSKPGATINVGCSLAAESYRSQARNASGNAPAGGAPTGQAPLPPTAFISAGHSGAVMASAILNMGRLRGIERPAIAIKLPTLSPNGCVLLDVGANVDCKPEHLRDFAIMGAIFAQVERQTQELPKVGVLSNGEERSKGNELTRAALTLIDQINCFRPTSDRAEHAGLPIAEFVGYVEGKEIFKGQVDAVVTDGFVGNVVLKSLEGIGSAVVASIKQESKRSLLTPVGFLLAAGTLRRLKRKLDYAEYGAAPLLGVAGYAFICHGRSNPKAIKSALLRARAALESRYVEKLEAALGETTAPQARKGATPVTQKGKEAG